MNGKKIIGFVLLFGAVVAFGNKLAGGLSSNPDSSIELYFLAILGLLLFFGIRRVLRS